MTGKDPKEVRQYGGDEWVPIAGSYSMGAWTILFTRWAGSGWEFAVDEIGRGHMGDVNIAKTFGEDNDTK